jgi:hypothetical protein
VDSPGVRTDPIKDNGMLFADTQGYLKKKDTVQPQREPQNYVNLFFFLLPEALRTVSLHP